MDSSSRILIDEGIMAERMGPEGNKLTATFDLQMLIICNGKERTEAQWKGLLKSADERLVVERVWKAKKGDSGIIEARLA